MYKVGLSLGVLALISMKQVQADDDDNHHRVRRHNDDDHDDEDHCNHPCAAACAANGEDDDCFEECGCEEEDGYDDLDDVLHKYSDYQAASRKTVQADKLQKLGPQYQAAQVQAKSVQAQSQTKFQQAFQKAGFQQGCNMNCVQQCTSANLAHPQQCYSQCGCINLYSARPSVASQQSLFYAPAGYQNALPINQFVGGFGVHQVGVSQSPANLHVAQQQAWANQFSVAPSNAAGSHLATQQAIGNHFTSGLLGTTQPQPVTQSTQANTQLPLNMQIGQRFIPQFVSGAAQPAAPQTIQQSAEFLKSSQSLLTAPGSVSTSYTTQTSTPQTWSYTSTSTIPSAQTTVTTQQTQFQTPVQQAKQAMSWGEQQWNQAQSQNHWSTKSLNSATTQLNQASTQGFGLNSQISAGYNSVSTPVSGGSQFSYSSTQTIPAAYSGSSISAAAYEATRTIQAQQAAQLQATNVGLGSVGTIASATIPAASATTLTAAQTQAQKTQQWGTWADKWYNYQSPHSTFTVPPAPTAAEIAAAATAAAATVTAATPVVEAAVVDPLAEVEAAEAAEAGTAAEEVVAADAVAADPAAEATVAADAAAVVDPAAAVPAAPKSKAEMTVVEYQAYVEEQRTQDRVSAAAIAKYVMGLDIGQMIQGEFEGADLNILGESLTPQSTNIQVQLSQIREKLTQTLVQQRQGFDVTKLGICSQGQVSQPQLSTPASRVSAMLAANQISLTPTAQAAQISKNCIPQQAIISTTPAGVLATSKLFQRVIDAGLLNNPSSANVEVIYLPEFENAQRVKFIHNGTTFDYYILIRNALTTQEVIILDKETYTVKSIYSASLLKNLNSPTGYSITLSSFPESLETVAFIQTFIDSQTLFIVGSMQNVAVSKAGALYIHQNTSQAAASSWEIITDSVTTLSTKMLVRALDANKTAISYYIIDVAPYETLGGAFQLTITDNSNVIHKLVVLIQSTANVMTLSFDSVVIQNHQIVAKYVITLDYQAGGYLTSHTPLTTNDARLDLLINQFNVIKEVIVISEESSAAVQALMKWVFNANVAEVTIRKISDSMRGSRLQIVYQTFTYTVDVIQIRFDGENSIYQIHFKEPTGAVAVYNIIVINKGSQVYEVSVLIGTTLVATYQLTLVPVVGQRNAFTSSQIVEVMGSQAMTTVITTYKRYITDPAGFVREQTLKTVDQSVTASGGQTTVISTGNVIQNTTSLVVGPSSFKNITDVTVETTVQTLTSGKGLDVTGLITGAATTIQSKTTEVTTTGGSGASTVITTSTTGGNVNTGSSGSSTLVIGGGSLGGLVGNSTSTTTSTTTTTGGSNLSQLGLNLVSEGVKTITTSKTVNQTVTSTTEGGSTNIFTNSTQITNTGVSTGVTTKISNTTTSTTASGTTLVGTLDYSISRNPVTNEEYRIYTNGTVVNSKGFILTTNGAAELARIISTTVTTTLSADGTYSIATYGGVTYFIYLDGRVTTDKGVFVTSNGIDGLSLYIQTLSAASSSSATSTTTTTTTSTSTSGSTVTGAVAVAAAVDPTYQIIILSDGSRYKLYPDGNVISMTGQIVSTTGLAGFTTYLTTSTVVRTITQTIAPEYDIVIANGVEYHLYLNQTITTASGEFVVNGGIEALRTYLTTTRTVTTTVAADYQIVNANGVEYRLYSNGSAYDAAGVLASTGGVEGLRTFLTTYTTTTTTIVPDFQIVTANGVDYKMFNNGSVFDPAGVWVTEGGVEGIRGFLTSGARIGSNPNLSTTGATALFLNDVPSSSNSSLGFLQSLLVLVFTALVGFGAIFLYNKAQNDKKAMKFEENQESQVEYKLLNDTPVSVRSL